MDGHFFLRALKNDGLWRDLSPKCPSRASTGIIYLECSSKSAIRELFFWSVRQWHDDDDVMIVIDGHQTILLQISAGETGILKVVTSGENGIILEKNYFLLLMSAEKRVLTWRWRDFLGIVAICVVFGGCHRWIYLLSLNFKIFVMLLNLPNYSIVLTASFSFRLFRNQG